MFIYIYIYKLSFRLMNVDSSNGIAGIGWVAVFRNWTLFKLAVGDPLLAM